MYETVLLRFVLHTKRYQATIMKPTHLHRPMGMVALVSLECSVAWTVPPALSTNCVLVKRHKAGPVSNPIPPSSIVLMFIVLALAVFSLNEPDISGISPGDAASWYQKYINPLVFTSCVLKDALLGLTYAPTHRLF